MALSHLNGWRALESVLRLGSVSEAAAELGVTSAAVGGQLRALEARLGRALFARAPSGLEPTEAAREVADRLTAGFAAIASVQQSLTERRRDDSVSITTTQTFAETWLPHHMPDLFARVARIDPRLDTTWDVVDLRHSDLDFAIRYMGPAGPEYGALTLFPSGVVPVCTPDFARRYGLGPERRSLDGVPIIRIGVPTSDPDWCDWEDWSGRTGIVLPDRVAVSSLELSGSGLRLASSGIGLVLGGLSETLDAVAGGRLGSGSGAKLPHPGPAGVSAAVPVDRTTR